MPPPSEAPPLHAHPCTSLSQRPSPGPDGEASPRSSPLGATGELLGLHSVSFMAASTAPLPSPLLAPAAQHQSPLAAHQALGQPRLGPSLRPSPASAPQGTHHGPSLSASPQRHVGTLFPALVVGQQRWRVREVGTPSPASPGGSDVRAQPAIPGPYFRARASSPIPLLLAPFLERLDPDTRRGENLCVDIRGPDPDSQDQASDTNHWCLSFHTCKMGRPCLHGRAPVRV